jgi:hypothetical protein
VDVEKFNMQTILGLLTVGCIIAVDVAKTKFVAAIATAAGEVLKLVRFEHPRQTWLFLHLLEALREAKLEPKVVMEPTGTYGDALRYQCHRREIAVHMMPPKYSHDFAEVLDGVPSMHDREGGDGAGKTSCDQTRAGVGAREHGTAGSSRVGRSAHSHHAHAGALPGASRSDVGAALAGVRSARGRLQPTVVVRAPQGVSRS